MVACALAPALWHTRRTGASGSAIEPRVLGVDMLSWRFESAVPPSAPFPRLPPGPATAPLFQVLRWLRQPLAFLDECAARHGDSFTIRLAAAPPLVVFSDPDHLRAILTGDPDLLRAGDANRALAPVLGPKSLLLLDGLRHREMRRVM